MGISVPRPPRTLLIVAGTPVQADVTAPLNGAGALVLCWLLVAGRYPGRSLLLRIPVCLLWTILLLAVFVLHSAGHVISARAAGAPMDVLVINAVHWITLYYNDGVSPRSHLGRAAGGPLANLTGILFAQLLRRILPPGPFGRDLADAFALFNALVGGAALLPGGSFDGGALLKWAVAARTGDLRRAARVVQTAGLGASVVLGGLAAVVLALRRAYGVALAAFSLVMALESLRRD